MHDRRFLALAFYPERTSDHSCIIAFQLHMCEQGDVLDMLG